MIVRDTAAPLPRAVLAVLAIAIARHLLEFATSAGSLRHVPPHHWVFLAVAEMALAAVAVHRPWLFKTRRFRLPGIAVVSIVGLLMIPLPPIVEAYGPRVARDMVLSLALGLATLAVVFWFSQRERPTPAVEQPRSRSRATIWGVAILAAALLPIWIATIGSLPIAELLTGQTTGIDIAGARSKALKEIGNAPLRLLIGAMRNLWIILAAAWLTADWRLTPRGTQARVLRGAAAGATTALAAFYALVTTERALLGHLTVALTVVAILAVKSQLKPRTAAFAVFGGLAFPLLFGLINAGRISGALNAITRRLFFVPADVMTLHFIAFPDRQDFLLGGSIPKIARLWGGSTFDLSGFIFTSFFGQSSAFVGNANSSFLAVGWANGGVAGVVIWAAVTGMTLVWLDRYLDQLPIRWSVALRGLAAVQTLLLSSSGIFRSLLGFAPGFLDLIVVAALVARFHRRASVTTPAKSFAVSRRTNGPQLQETS